MSWMMSSSMISPLSAPVPHAVASASDSDAFLSIGRTLLREEVFVRLGKPYSVFDRSQTFDRYSRVLYLPYGEYSTVLYCTVQYTISFMVSGCKIPSWQALANTSGRHPWRSSLYPFIHSESSAHHRPHTALGICENC